MARALSHEPCAEGSLHLLQLLLAAHEEPVCAPSGQLSIPQAMLCIWELAAQDKLDEATALLTQLIHVSDGPLSRVCQLLRLPSLDDEAISWLARWRLRIEEARP